MAFLKQMFGITNSDQKRATGTLNQAQQAGIGFGNTLRPMAENAFSATPGLLNTAGGTLNTALNFYRPIVAGDRSTMMSVLGPEVKQVSSGFDQSLANLREFSPRSGMSTGTAAELPFRKASTLSDLFAQTRLSAAGQLPAIASGQIGVANANTSLANVLGNQTNESYRTGVGAAGSSWQQQLEQLKLQWEMYRQFGQALAGMMGG